MDGFNGEFSQTFKGETASILQNIFPTWKGMKHSTVHLDARITWLQKNPTKTLQGQ